MPAFRIKLPNSGVTTHLIMSERVTIGRAADNTIQIPHASVSSHHAEIVEVDGHYCLHDLHSTNRSYVEGKPVSDFDLHSACKILLGSVECEFDPSAVAPARRIALPAPAPVAKPESTYLENENRELRNCVHSLQRRFDILGSARLITGKSDLTPYGAAEDGLKSLSAERNDLRQENAGLRLQLEHLREALALTTRERDAARQAAETLQTERTALRVDLKKAQSRAEKLLAAATPAPAPPPRPPAVAPIAPPPAPAGVTPKTSDLPGPNADLLPEQIRVLREVIAQLSAAPAESALLVRADEVVAQVRRNSAPLGNHGIRRIARGMGDFLQDLARHDQPPETLPLRTLRHAGELLAQLLEPRLFATAQNLAPGEVLSIDDDAGILAAVATALTGAGLRVTGCDSAEAALTAIGAQRFDTIIADVHLPQMNGPAFCAHARELPHYRRTPILFLTVADTLDKRAETSLSGGNEFIAKPFNVSELALKVDCWVLKQQLQLL